MFGGGVTYQLSLGFKKGEPNTKSLKDRLYLKGWDTKKNKKVNWDDADEDGTNAKWRLAVYKSGGTRLLLNNKESVQNEGWIDNNTTCDKRNLFLVTKSTYDDGTWEDDVSKIMFDTDKCDSGLKQKGCVIKIKDGVGLKWGPELEKQLTKS